MIDSICKSEECTGCKACSNVCPVNCIIFNENELGELHPHIGSSCIECHQCQRVCPNNNQLQFHLPQTCSVAWSKDDEIRRQSASGGIATEIYRLCIAEGWYSVGCAIDNLGNCYYMPVTTVEDLDKVRNSKYVFSDANDIYKRIAEQLKTGKTACFIGLPCQVAGLKCFLRKDYENLVTIDLVCHGVSPDAYLRQHIHNIEPDISKISRVYFRDPEVGTANFRYSLIGNTGSCLYAKGVYDNDTYQVGYHKALIYRNNCYACHYARQERISDLTISDFSGLGKCEPFTGLKQNVSCILVNTSAGENLLDMLRSRIESSVRPIEEAFNYEHQLKSPSVPHPQRPVFLDAYRRTQDFDMAVKTAIGSQLRRYHIKHILRIAQIKKTGSRLIPRSIKSFIKKFV